MKKIITLICIILIFLSCNDGDFDVPSFNFSNQDINECGNLVLFKINENEALFFELNNNNIFINENTTVSLNNISYRIFDSNVTASYFCNEIPPTIPITQNQWIGNGELIVENTINKDDNDGVGETDLTLDTDGDQIPNYYDSDDDGDGILTSNEVTIDTNGNTVLTDADNDGTPDYLEFTTLISTENTYTISYVASFVINNFSLINNDGNAINFDTYDFGTKTGDTIITN